MVVESNQLRGESAALVSAASCLLPALLLAAGLAYFLPPQLFPSTLCPCCTFGRAIGLFEIGGNEVWRLAGIINWHFLSPLLFVFLVLLAYSEFVCWDIGELKLEPSRQIKH